MTTIAIFGAASAIAQDVARLYAADGYSFFLAGRNGARLETIAQDLKARGAVKVTTSVTDLSDTAKHQELIAQAKTALGTMDRALVAYGTLGDQQAGQADTAILVRELNVNFVSAASLLSLLADAMIPNKAGKIAVIGSVAGDRGRQSNYIYGSAKAGLGAFVMGLRHRLAPNGISVTLVKPGFVDTPMTAAFPKGPLWASPAQVARDIRTAMERGAAVLYTPWFWRWIMLIIRSVPDVIFRRTRL